MRKSTTNLVNSVLKRIRNRATSNFVGVKRKRRTFSCAKLGIESLEQRHLLAASYFSPSEPAGNVNVQLLPLANVAAGVEEIVTFGVPFTRGSVTPSQLAQVRVLKDGQEIPAFVEQLTPWRSIDNASIDGQSVRVARIQIPYTFAALSPESVTVQWGGPSRTLNRSAMQDPRIEWHQVTSGTFIAADNVEEPDVLPLLPKEYLSKGMLDARTQPTSNNVAETRDDPATMDSMTFTGYSEYDYAEKNFFYTIINQNPGITINYKTDYEPWLYDRSTAMYELYLRSGFATSLREAVRSADFYADHLSASGYFTLKSPDPKYSYNESLAYTYWLLGDNRMLTPISTIVDAHNGSVSRWGPNLGFWTERNAGYKLLANQIAYEVTGNTTFKSSVQTIVNDLIWHQNGAGGQLPSNRVDGGLYHIGQQHDASEVGDPNVIIASSWMSTIVVDAMARSYGVWENAQVADFIVRMGNFEKVASKWDASGQFGGFLRYPDYLMRADGTSENRTEGDVQHAMDVGSVAAWASYFAELRGTPDASLRQLANELYATYDEGVNYWTRPGGTNFNVSPPRRYSWEYKNSASFSWALNGTDGPPQPGALQFDAAAYTANENQGSIVITVARTGGNAGTVSVNYATSNGTATAGSDYIASSGTLTFADNETSKTFLIPLLDDIAIENAETVTLTLSDPTGGATLANPSIATLTINSNDVAGQPLTITRQQGVSGYTGTSDVNISTQYVEYTEGNGTTNFSGDQLGVYQTSGTGSYSVESLIRFSDLGIPADATVNAATLTMHIDTWANPTVRGYYLVAPWSAIPGSNSSQVGWLHRGTGQDWVTPGARGQGTDVAANQSFLLSGIAGTGGQDITVDLDATMVQSWVNNGNANQGVLLVNESPDAVIYINSSDHAAIPSRPKLSVTFSVPTPGVLQFNLASYTVNENAGTATITVSRTGGSAGSVGVNYATSNGTATAGSDYTSSSGTLNFAAGQTSATFTIPILNDAMIEGDETVNISLSNPSGGATLGSQATATLTIISDDVPQPGVLQFGAASYTVNENAGTAIITVTRTGGSDGSVGVNYATSNGSAIAGSDYATSNGTLSFSNGETSKTFSIPILNDTAVENAETVTLTLSNPAGGATLGTPATATLTINSDDVAGQPVTVTRQQGVSGYTGTSDVNISTQYAQYTGGNGTTTFDGTQLGVYQTTGSNSYSIESLIRFSDLGIPTNASVSAATLTLYVDTWTSKPTVRGYYVLAPWSSTPGSNATQVGWLHRGTGQDWAVPGARGLATDVVANPNFVLSGIKGNGGQYVTINLEPAVVQTWVNNPNANQGVLLVNETAGGIVRFNASEHGTTATRPKLSVTYTVGTPQPQPGVLQFGAAGYTVSENAGSATITVSRTGGSDGSVSVNYATSNGSATAGSDYTSTSGTLTFAAGQTSATFAIPIVNDTTVEGDEFVNISLSNPTGGATLGSQLAATLTIISDDVLQPGVLQFSASSYTVNENAGTATITVTRTGGSDGSVGVNYATSNGTATAGSDYTASSGTVTFANGETSKTFSIPILDDTTVENAETVTLTLSNPTPGATLGNPATATLTINSEDVSSQPVTVTLQQGVNGYAGTSDVSISTQYVEYTGGNGSTTFNDSQLNVFQTVGTGAYTIESLLRFSDLGIPAGAMVNGATLTLYVDSWDPNPTLRGYYLLAPWSATPSSSITQVGWLHRGTGQDWASPGALGVGSDIAASPTFVLSGITGNGGQSITVNLDPAVVQSWVNDPNANQGVLLVNESPGAIVRINASDHTTIASRPKLSITYSVGALPPPSGGLQFNAASSTVNENAGKKSGDPGRQTDLRVSQVSVQTGSLVTALPKSSDSISRYSSRNIDSRSVDELFSKDTATLLGRRIF